MRKAFYAIRKGRKNNVVVTSWDECSKLVTGYPGAVFKGFGFMEEEKAKAYAMSTATPKYLKKPVKKAAKKQGNVYGKSIGKCIERRSYRDPFTGVFYKNRCVIRRGPTITGEFYQPTDITSCPF